VVDAESEQVEVIQFSTFPPCSSYYFAEDTSALLLFYAKVRGLFIYLYGMIQGIA
jgi:hypothetical protein